MRTSVHRIRFLWLVGLTTIVLLTLLAACSNATPTPTPGPTATSTPVPTATPTATPLATPTPTGTPMPTVTPTATPTPTSTPTPTATPTPTPTPAPKYFGLVNGWYKTKDVQYYDFGTNTPLVTGRVPAAPIFVLITGMDAQGNPQFVSGQHNIVDVLPGDTGYSDLWQVNLVTVPSGYQPDTLRSVADVLASGYPIELTQILVNCPIVPAGSTTETGMALTQGWYRDQMVYYFDYGPNPDFAAPIYALITGMDPQGNPLFVQGQRNIIDVVPGDPGYSAFWQVNLVTVPSGYDANSINSVSEVMASGYSITATDILVNCPVVNSSSVGTPPVEATAFANDWPLPNFDYANTRATTSSTIDSSNVSTLGAAWVHNIPSGQSTFGSISTTPIIINGTVYIQDIGNNVMALDLGTGALKWQKVYNLANTGPNGVSVGYGKVFGSAGPYDVVALDSQSGEELWRTKLIDIEQGQNGIDIQTVVYDDKVYVSTVPGNSGVFYAGGGRGILYALDQNDGSVLWSFDTVDSPDVWGNPIVNSGGGSWYPPAIDTDTGWSYWAIANPAPFPGYPAGPGVDQDWPNGTSRPGPNLYSNTLMQLDHNTGEMGWYNQVWPHDISDYDLQISPILASANYAGKQQDIVIGAGKMGQVYAFNRETGAIIWQTAVGEHNGNDRLGVYPLDGSITLYPGILGGVETPMAYADGVVYVPSLNLPVTYIDGVTLTLSFAGGTGDLTAIDVNTGHILWTHRFDSMNVGGATVVNDLVFTATFDGMMYAFDRETGEQVWSYKAPASVNAWPAVVGDTMVWPVAGGGGPSSIIGFKLGSTAPAVKFVSPEAGESLPAGDVTVQVEVTNFNLVDQLGQANVAGEGHLHYYLDVVAPTTPGQPAIPPSGSVWAASPDSTYTFTDVAPGSHTISVQLVNNDHTPLSLPVVITMTVTTDTDPRIEIAQPPNGAVRRSGSIDISVSVSNFNLVAKLGQPNVAGEGHIHYYMDVEPPTTPGQPAIPPAGSVWAPSVETTHTFENVPDGIHNFYVQLVNNDHTPVEGVPIQQIQLFAISWTGGFGGQ